MVFGIFFDFSAVGHGSEPVIIVHVEVNWGFPVLLDFRKLPDPFVQVQVKKLLTLLDRFRWEATWSAIVFHASHSVPRRVGAPQLRNWVCPGSWVEEPEPLP